MLKYLLAFIAGLAGLFIGVLLAAAIAPHAEWLHKGLGAGFAIGAAQLVYSFMKKRETDKQHHIEGPAMLSTDILNFRKVFQSLDCPALGITEVKFLERADQTSFYVGLRSQNYASINFEAITKPLYKLYYSHVQFEFVDLNSDEGKFLVEKGVQIPLKEGGV